jgi:hypothetical protein
MNKLLNVTATATSLDNKHQLIIATKLEKKVLFNNITGIAQCKKCAIAVHSTRLHILEARTMIQQINNSVQFITHPTLLQASLVSRYI